MFPLENHNNWSFERVPPAVQASLRRRPQSPRVPVVVALMLTTSLLAFTACSRPAGGQPAARGASAGAPSGARSGAASQKVDPTSDDADACVLLTRSEAEALLEEPVEDTTSGPLSMRNGGAICLYGSAVKNSARTVSVRIEPTTINWDQLKKDRISWAKSTQPYASNARSVPGLGDDAFFAGHTLYVRRGRTILTISMFKTVAGTLAHDNRDTPEDALEKQIAQRALSRMR